MMSQRRTAVAALAAVFLFLSSVTAVAAGVNSLSNGSASPTSGTTQTVFVFSVRYQSSKGWAAQKVTAAAAGKSVTLRLVSGSSINGTYEGSSTLPAGTWSVTFASTSAKGPGSTLAGPTLTVRLAAPAPIPTPKATPKSTPKPAAVTTATPNPTLARTPAATNAPSSAAGHAGGSRSTTTATATATSSASPTAAPVGAGAGTTTPGKPSSLPAALLGLVAAGLLAGLGALLLMDRRRRESDEEERAVDEPAVERPAATRPRPDPARRGEDPILAAMGIGNVSTEAVKGEGSVGMTAPIARQVRLGPGERPSRRPR